MPHWIWQHTDWPHFTWDEAVLSPILGQARLAQGQLLGVAKSLAHVTQIEISSQALSDETMTTSAIEGEHLDRDSVRSSIGHRLGLSNAGVSSKPNHYIEGLLDILLDATQDFKKPLTLDRLKAWQAALFPTGYSGLHKINVGELRGHVPMQIISGSSGKTKLHFEAPPRKDLTQELNYFLKWFNGRSSQSLDGLIRAGIAHLWFEILHPFDDGNGRVGRTIVDMVLAQDEQLAMRFYSLSLQIMEECKSYYQILVKTCKANLDITEWLHWFLTCYQKAIVATLDKIDGIVKKSQFWQVYAKTQLNKRQRKVLNRLLGEGIKGFEGGMTTRKYIALTKTSRATYEIIYP